MDIHDTAFSLYTALVAKQDLSNASEESRVALGREAYKLAEAFVAAKDTYIRELPVTQVDVGY
jgi:hypothetical protein